MMYPGNFMQSPRNPIPGQRAGGGGGFTRVAPRPGGTSLTPQGTPVPTGPQTTVAGAGGFGMPGRAESTQPPGLMGGAGAGGAYGNPARGGYTMPSTGPGDRRYYDTGRNDLMARYDDRSGDLQGMYDKRVNSLNRALQGYGNQQLADARQAGQNLGSDIGASMVGRGLSGTTLYQAGQTMASNATQNNVNRIQEQLQNQKVGLAERTTGDALGFGERAMQGGTALGQANLRDSRGDFESDRGFGEGQFQADRAFGRGSYEDDRNFNRGVYESDRDFGDRNFDRDRGFNYQRELDNRNLSFRDRNFDYQRYLDSLNRNDRIRLEQLGFMERRNDQYPDINMLMELMQGQGQYGLV